VFAVVVTPSIVVTLVTVLPSLIYMYEASWGVASQILPTSPRAPPPASSSIVLLFFFALFPFVGAPTIEPWCCPYLLSRSCGLAEPRAVNTIRYWGCSRTFDHCIFGSMLSEAACAPSRTPVKSSVILLASCFSNSASEVPDSLFFYRGLFLCSPPSPAPRVRLAFSFSFFYPCLRTRYPRMSLVLLHDTRVIAPPRPFIPESGPLPFALGRFKVGTTRLRERWLWFLMRRAMIPLTCCVFKIPIGSFIAANPAANFAVQISY
jgi:hypothetical protein